MMPRGRLHAITNFRKFWQAMFAPQEILWCVVACGCIVFLLHCHFFHAED